MVKVSRLKGRERRAQLVPARNARSRLALAVYEEEQRRADGYSGSPRARARRERRLRRWIARPGPLAIFAGKPLTMEDLLAAKRALEQRPAFEVRPLFFWASAAHAEACRREGVSTWEGALIISLGGRFIEADVEWWQEAIRQLNRPPVRETRPETVLRLITAD